MKTKLLLTVLLSFAFYLLSSQVPQGFNYQAIARDGSGNVIPNQPLPVKIDIVDALTGGNLIYEELFSSITSNQFGLISLVVGTGTPQSGGQVTSFSAIDWKSKPLYIRTIIYYPTGTWTTMGTSQIMSVPYTLIAKDVQGPVTSLTSLGIAGTTDLMDSALFAVRNKAGNIVFAVYNEGIRAYVGNGSKGAKGGFAVGGYDATKGSSTIYDLFVLNTDSARLYVDSKPNLKGARGGFSVGGYDMTKGTVQDYLDVSKDSIRVYVDSNPATKGAKGGFSVGGYDMTKGIVQDYLDVSADSIRAYIAPSTSKGAKGGFAVGGFDATKTAVGEEYLRVTRDSSRIYVLNPSTKGAKGGFAVGGFDLTKGGASIAFTSLTPKNYFIGYESGQNITSGQYNATLGYESGMSLTTGISNSFIGYQAGKENTEGYMNDFNGYQSGLNNIDGNWNVFIGMQSGLENTSGSANTFVGNNSGQRNTVGYGNVSIGDAAGYMNKTGNENINIGGAAGFFNVEGVENVSIGYEAGYSSTTSGNVFIGWGAGEENQNGQHNMISGSEAGYGMEGSNNTYIGYSSASGVKGSNNTFLGCETGNGSVSGCVFLGYQAGVGIYDNNTLHIANSSYNTLIYGQFDTKRVGIATTDPGNYTLYVNGFAYSTGGWAGSDIRWKKDIIPLTDVLGKLLSLNGVNYEWRKTEFPEINFDSGQQIGLIAQEVEKVFPELVRTDDKGYKAVSYEKLSVVLLEGMKEQQKLIEGQQEQIESTKQENHQLRSEINELKSLVNNLIANQTAQVNK